MTVSLKLFSTSACHLCEHAIRLLSGLDANDFRWEEIEISDDEILLENYGERIPVLLNSHSGKTLNWPFTTQEIIALIQDQ